MDLKRAVDIFALHDVGPVERLADGKFTISGTFAKRIGLQPGKEVFEAGSGTWRRTISARQGRAAVNTLFRNELSKQGKAFNRWLQNTPSGVFKDLQSMPHRISLSALEANAARNKTFGLRKYLEMTVPFVNQHAGGIIGDSIKEEYFRAGRMKWQPLSMDTIKSKKRRYAKYGGRVPHPAIPLHGVTWTPGLPEGWQAYTYRWANWPHGVSGTFQGPNIGGAAGYTMPGASLHRNITTYLASGRTGGGVTKAQREMQKAGSSSGFFGKPYKTQKGWTAYPPHMRGTSLMDVVARLAPIAQVTYPYAGRNYRQALKAAAAKDSPRGGQMKIGGIVEPFYTTPYVFYHDSGTSKMPKRSFISEGLANGMGMVELVLHRYLEDGAKNFNRAYRETEIDAFTSFNDINTAYMRGSVAQVEAIKSAKIRGRAGLKKEPRVTLFDLQTDNLINKSRQMKGILRRMFGNHLIWWFVPPSKYWHYVGLMSDIRGLLFGKKNLGAAVAYVKALSLGLAGARAGTPVPFTRKARRRKFRQNLYTRAGYHRTQVGGSR